MKHFRWKYVLPRLAIVLTIILSTYFGLDPLLHWAIVAGGESAVGAKFELASLRSSLAQGKLELGSLQIANPRSPWRNLLQAEGGLLQIDSQALLNRRLVISEGSLHGLEWNTERSTSGALIEQNTNSADNRDPSAKGAPWLESGRQMGADWFGDVRARLEQDLVGQLETPRVVQDLQDRWPPQVAEMRNRIDSLRAQSEQLQGQLKAAKKNPLRSLEQLQQLAQPIQDMQQQLLAVQQQLNQWPEQAKLDRQAMEVARTHDQQFLRESLHVDGLDGQQLSDQLLGPLVAERLQTILRWVHTVRSLAPNRAIRVESDSVRGVNVHYLGPQPQPRIHLRQLALSGSVRLGATSTDWIGKLTDVSNQPALLNHPTRLHMQGVGPMPFQVDLSLDRTGTLARDEITIECPNLPLPSSTLGGGTLTMQLLPGKTGLQLHLTLTEDQLAGQIVLMQPSVQIQRLNRSTSTEKPAMVKLAQLVEQSLAQIEQLETTIKLSGTLDQPQWKIESNLGPQIAQGTNRALQQLLQQQVIALQESIGKQAQQRLTQLAEQREKAQRKLLARLGENRHLVEQLAQLGGGKEVTIPKLGKWLDALQR
ncbi:MAG: TIGR03545 family protein [Pirellulales bacterium]